MTQRQIAEARRNHEWVTWLHTLAPWERRLVYKDECYYYYEWLAGHFSFFNVLEEAGVMAEDPYVVS